jgi:hypothetical protein
VSTSAWRLRPFDLFARVVATWPASFGRLDGLAVDDRTRGTRLASGPFAIEHDKGVINLLEAALITEFRKPTVDRAPRRQIARQQTPRTARSHHIKNAIDDLTHRPGARTSRALCHRQARLDHSPRFICQIALVSVGLVDMLLSDSWGPDVATPGLVSATPGITPTPVTQHYSEWPLALK